ncbi:MAG TPA: ABC transporter permease [Desulfatiglandales bacterium]|nr:ABC transporter permease [Desulfatiglandales bacterium]
MLRYILNRLVYLIPVVFFMSLVVFSFIHLIPGDPVDSMLGFEATDQARTALRQELGLDRNILVQYGSWAGKLLTGDFGKSIVSRKPVLSLILEKFPATLVLAIAATAVAVFLGLLFGTFAASRRNSIMDLAALTLALFWVSIPSFWLGILLILIFSLTFPVFPSMGYGSILKDFLTGLYYLTLPALTLGAVEAGALTRMTRAEMIEQLGKDYVITAMAKGLPRRVVLYKHALRNSLIPVVTFIGLQLGTLLGGTVVVEQIFAWPGVGRLVIEAIFARDYPMVQGIVLFYAVIFIVVNLLVDISYTFLNPQIRLSRRGA